MNVDDGEVQANSWSDQETSVPGQGKFKSYDIKMSWAVDILS